MLILFWLAANAALIWYANSLNADNVSDPIAASWGIVLGFLVMNLIFGGFFIWG